MKRYRIVKVDAKNTYYKIQKKNIFGWWDVRRIITSSHMGVVPLTELTSFGTEAGAREYVNSYLKPMHLKETVIEEFAF